MFWGRLRFALPVLVPAIITGLLIGSCSEKRSPVIPADTTPPAAVTNLAPEAATATSVLLTWTAPGDDGATGTAHQYDFRYSTSPITAANFASAAPAAGAPAPGAAGASQSFMVSGLTPSTPYYFAMRTADEVPNWSVISNLAQATTGPAADTTPPAAVADLATGTVTATSVQLTWTAPGDDGTTGTAHLYDIRYSTSAITSANFAAALVAAGAPTPAAAGSAQSVTVNGLSPNTPYYFAMKTADEVPNWSEISNLPHVTTEQTTDTTPPAAVNTLAPGTLTATSVQLTWTAPGDDGATGTAHQYDIRYSTSAITAGNFASAAEVTGLPAPMVAGSSQSVTVVGLSPNTPYYFAMKTADEVPNWSGLSNVVQATTAPAADTTPPAAIANLATGTLTTTSIELTWTAPGDDGATGTAHQYDIRHSTAAITAGNFASATPVSGVPTPAAAGTVQSVIVEGLTPNTPYYFAMKTADEVPNWSGLSNVVTAQTQPTAVPPPALSGLSLPDSVCISSNDPYAQAAKNFATLQLSIARAYAAYGTAFFGPLANADWVQNGDCWDWTYGAGGCTYSYHACKTGTVYEYTLTYNGNCGIQYSNWVAYRSTYDTATGSGSFFYYEPNTTTILIAWTWTRAADGLSGNYSIYNGDPATAALVATIDWANSADGNTTDMTFTMPAQSKWVSHFEKVPCSGWLKMYQWDDTGSTWWLETDIAWNADGTGFYNTYDSSGTLQETHTW